MTRASSPPPPALLDHLEARLQRALDDPFAALLAEAELRALLRLVAHARAAAQDDDVEAPDPPCHAPGAGARERPAVYHRRVTVRVASASAGAAQRPPVRRSSGLLPSAPRSHEAPAPTDQA